MIVERRVIDIEGIPVEIVRKNIKHLHLTVYPPKGKVRVSLPFRMNDEAVRREVISRLDWIRRHQERFRLQERVSRRDYITGEILYYQGRRYRLDVIEHDGRASVRIVNGETIVMRVRPGADRKTRKAILDGWYRIQLQYQLPELLSKWEHEVGVKVAELRIRRMKTRWGTCNIQARRIWLNLELARKPLSCLEYILVHEMVHLHERLHNKRFYRLMDRLMPEWRICRKELSREPQAGGNSAC